MSAGRTLFSVVGTTILDQTDGKPMEKCFIGPRWAPRNKNYDGLVTGSRANACVITALAPLRDWSFVTIAAFILGKNWNISTLDIGNLLIKSGYTAVPAQAEKLVEATDKHGTTGMCVDGYNNFLFVETGDPKDPVAVLGFCCREFWYVYGYRFCRTPLRSPHNRLLIPNLGRT